jgi:hypothetical protein
VQRFCTIQAAADVRRIAVHNAGVLGCGHADAARLIGRVGVGVRSLFGRRLYLHRLTVRAVCECGRERGDLWACVHAWASGGIAPCVDMHMRVWRAGVGEGE